MTVDVEMPESVEDYELDDPSVETIIGLPDDTFTFNPGLSKLSIRQPQTFPSKRTPQTSTSFILPTTKQTKTMTIKPSFLKVITKKPTEKPQQQQIKVMHNYKPQAIKRSYQLIEIDPGDVDLKPEKIDSGLNKLQVQKSNLIYNKPQTTSQQLQKSNQRLQRKNPQQLKLFINSQTNLQNNQSMQQQKNNQPKVVRNQSVQKYQQNMLNKPQVQKNQQLKMTAEDSSKGPQQTIKQVLQPSPVTVITVPYDNG